MRSSRKRTDDQKYIVTTTVRMSSALDDLVTARAFENHCSKNEIIRQAIYEYMNKNMSDNEIFHASLNEIKHQLYILDNKVKKYPAIIYTAVRKMFSLLPERSSCTEAELAVRMKDFSAEVAKTASGNRNGVFETILIDCIENNLEAEG